MDLALTYKGWYAIKPNKPNHVFKDVYGAVATGIVHMYRNIKRIAKLERKIE